MGRQASTCQGDIVRLLKPRRVRGQVGEEFKGRGEWQVRFVAHHHFNRCVATALGRQQGAHGQHAHLVACPRQGVDGRRSDGIGRGEQGLVVAEEQDVLALLRHVPFRLVEIEDVQAEVAVVVAAVAPIHVYKTILIQSIYDKGMPLHAHRIGGIQYGTACAQFAFDERPPVVRRIFITIHVAHILPAHHPLQRVNKPTDIRTALARSPVHVAGHAEPVRQAGHGVGLLLGVGSLVVLC